MLLFSAKRRGEREAAERIYAACLAAARRPELYLGYGVPDTLQGRFEMVALALFPVLNRLMHEPGDDPELARLVSESFVDDMDAAFREMGRQRHAVPKRMKTLYSSFAGRIDRLSAGAWRRRAALASAVARNVFPDEPRGRARGSARRVSDGCDGCACAAADIVAASARRDSVPAARLGAKREAAHERSRSRPPCRSRQIPAGGKHVRIEADEAQRRAHRRSARDRGCRAR